MHSNLIVGLTGGMGGGKSTAVSFFADFGFVPIDSDALVHDLLLNNGEVIDAIRMKFGDAVFGEDGTVRRDRLSEKVFGDAAALDWLEALLHTRLYARWRQVFAQGSRQAFIVEVPLLFEKGLENWFDFTVCVTTQSALQLRRLEQKGIPLELAQQRLAKQLPLARKCELADHVLLNDGIPDFLREQVNALADRLLKQTCLAPRPHLHGPP